MHAIDVNVVLHAHRDKGSHGILPVDPEDALVRLARGYEPARQGREGWFWHSLAPPELLKRTGDA